MVLFDELDGEVGIDIVDPADRRRGHAVDLDGAIEIFALADEARGVIEAGPLATLAAVMPFADVGGFVASRAQEAGVGDAIQREGRVVVGDAVRVIVATGQIRRAAGSTERERHEGVAKADALGGEPVHVG